MCSEYHSGKQLQKLITTLSVTATGEQLQITEQLKDAINELCMLIDVKSLDLEEAIRHNLEKDERLKLLE